MDWHRPVNQHHQSHHLEPVHVTAAAPALGLITETKSV